MSRFAAFLVILLLVATQAIAAVENDYLVESYSTREGLSNNYISYIFNDSEGYLWLGTWDGLSRFDGYGFKTYDSFKHPELTNSRILSIREDDRDHLWIVTHDRSLYRFSKKSGYYDQIALPEGFRHTGRYFSPSGIVWLWTKTTLLKIEKNGKQTTVTTINIPGGADINFVNEIDESTFIGSSLGLFEISRGSDALKAISKDASLQYTATSDGVIFVSTSTNGIIVYHTISGKLDKLKDTQSFPRITSLHHLKSGSLMIGTKESGIIMYDISSGQATNFTKSNSGIPDNRIVRIHKENDERFWICTEQPGMTLYRSSTGSFSSYKLDIEDNPVSTGIVVRRYRDKVLLNSYKQGLAVYDPQTDTFDFLYKELGIDNTLFSQSAHYLLVDQQDNIWISPWSKKLYKISHKRNKVEYRLPTPGSTRDMANEVRAVCETPDGELWIGTRGSGLFLLDKEKNEKLRLRYFTDSQGRQQWLGNIYSILLKKDGEIWCGTKGDGIIRIQNINGSYKATQLTESKLNDLSVYAMCEDMQGRIWIATFESGIYLMTFSENGSKIWTRSDFAEYPTHHRYVRTLLIDSSQRLWAGTSDGLLMANTTEPDIASIEIKDIKSSFPNLALTDVHSVLEAQDNTIWIGSTGGGLTSLTKGENSEGGFSVKRYGKDDGLPNNSIIALCEDNQGSIWIGTEDNVSNFKPLEEKFYTFSRADGFPELTISEKGAYRCTDGSILFATTNGYFYFDPSVIYHDDSDMNLVITDFSLLGGAKAPIIENDTIRLKYNQSFFSIEYAALDFAGAENIQYAYMLDNLENHWNYVNKERKATYTNLPHGKYTFRVWASKDSEFNELDPIHNLTIIIYPPFWLTNFAKMIYIIAILALIWLTIYLISHYYKMRHQAHFDAELHETKLRFFTNISHELRTPLTLITGPSEKLLTQDELSPQNREMVSHIYNNARALMGMVNQILDFRKVQNAKMEIHNERADIIALTRNIFNNINPAAQEKNINFMFSTNTPSLYTETDPEKFDTIVRNILSNAIKFTGEWGEIMLMANHNKEADQIEISIADTGIGMSKETLNNIFERFSSWAENSTSYKGTGIGLHLAKSYIDLLDGDIKVESSPNKGSKFTIVLPLKDAEIPEFRVSIHENADEAAFRILVVEDNPDLRKFIVSLLTEDFSVTEAENGIQALEVISTQSPDLILSDIMMPELDGIGLLEKIRADVKTSHIPVILISAKNSIEDQIKGLEYGADDYICKPFSTRLLRSKIEKVFAKRSKMYSDMVDGLNAVPLYPDTVVCQKRDEQMLRRVISLVSESMEDMGDFNISKLVKELGLSRTVFYKKIKSLTGLSPIELVRDIRIKRAAQLMATGEYNVSEVSIMVGFNDIRYFSRCFKKKFGVNPSEFKNPEIAADSLPEFYQQELSNENEKPV